MARKKKRKSQPAADPKKKAAPPAPLPPAPDSKKRPLPQRSAAGWENERKRAAETQAAKSRAGRDIAGDFPAVVDPKRKARAKGSYEFFCRTYFPDTFNLPWSNDHREAITLIEAAVQCGGDFVYAMPRGSGKTSLAEVAVLWATLFGYRSFVMVIGADSESATGILESVKSELECNELLLEDFPEVCYPIRKLEGIAHRANGQLYKGQRTHMEWTANSIVLPTIEGSPASAAVVRVSGITGSFRGKKHKRPDGKSVRPDLCVLDDPQTDESARSPSQCQQRIRILSGAVLGLAGPGKKIAAIMPCTVIEPGDMADEMLDRQRHPEWQGKRTKLIYVFPENEELWAQYKKVRADGLRAGDGGKAGTEFYRANREAMDKGAEVAWPVRHNPDELSAVQHAMNLRFDLGDRAFFAEYQNEPLPDHEVNEDVLTAAQIAAKTNGRERGAVPNSVTKIVSFVDVQKELLYWGVVGLEDDFSGYVLDYNTFPDQKRDYFTKRDAKKKLSAVLKTKSLEATIYQGLTELVGGAGELLTRKWIRDDGGEMQVEKCLVDANWGEVTDVIYQWCRESPHSAILVPTHGQYVGAKGRSFNDYRKKKGDECGDHWRRPAQKGKRVVRYGLFDANHWKSFLHARLAVAQGGPGCFSFFGEDPEEHKLVADHLTAEDPVIVEAKGKKVTEWQIRRKDLDNDFLDVLAGCCVAGSMLGVSLAERKQEKKEKRRQISLSELQKQSKHHAPPNGN